MAARVEDLTLRERAVCGARRGGELGMPPPRFTCGESPSEGCGDCKNDPTPGMVRSSSVLEDDRPEVVLSNGDDGGKIKRRGVASGATLEGARLGPTVLGLAID